MNSDASAIVVADGLSKNFDGKEVLTNLDLTLPAGTVMGLLGANGSGKTTLIKCLLGLLKPTAGTATVLGQDAWHLSAAAKEQIGYVPQEVATYPWMRVRHVIDYTAAFYPRWNRDLGRRHVPAVAVAARRAVRRVVGWPATDARHRARAGARARPADPGRTGSEPRPQRPPRVFADADRPGRASAPERVVQHPHHQRPGTRRQPDCTSTRRADRIFAANSIRSKNASNASASWRTRRCRRASA